MLSLRTRSVGLSRPVAASRRSSPTVIGPTNSPFDFTNHFATAHPRGGGLKGSRTPHGKPPNRTIDRVSTQGHFSRLICLRNNHLRSEEHTSELQSLRHLVCRLLL